MSEFYFAMNKRTRTACPLPFSHWELVQMAFRWGIAMPDGTLATGIGRHKTEATFRNQARRCNWRVVAN